MRVFRSAVPLISGLLALPAHAVTAPVEGWGSLVEGSQLKLLLRNSYFNRSKEEGRPDQRDWTQGINLDFSSGFTPGTLGVGMDGFVYQGLRLDASAGKTGTRNLPVRDNGEPADEYAKAGAALKLPIR